MCRPKEVCAIAAGRYVWWWTLPASQRHVCRRVRKSALPLRTKDGRTEVDRSRWARQGLSGTYSLYNINTTVVSVQWQSVEGLIMLDEYNIS